MGLWYDDIVICINKYITLKVAKNMTVFMSLILILRRFNEMGLLYDRFYVIDLNFAKVYRNGPSFHL